MIRHFLPDTNEDMEAAVLDALRGGRLSSGLGAARLEEAISVHYDGAQVVAVSSGTAALYLALKALNVGPGDTVCIPSYTCNSLYAAVAHAGAQARCVDCGSNLSNLDAAAVAAAMDERVKATILPHTCGFAADIEAVRRLGPPVIEDCAHAVGGRTEDGRPLGTLGDVAVLSFYATKLLPAGEGGACVTRNAQAADLMRRLRQCDEQPLHPWAFNFKMNDLCAAAALAAWRRLPDQIARREAMARAYDEALGPWSCRRRFAQEQSVCFRYLVATEDADSFTAAARAAGIECKRPVYRPLHFDLGGDCPRSESLHRHVVSIPCYPRMTADQANFVRDTVSRLLHAESSVPCAASSNGGVS